MAIWVSLICIAASAALLAWLTIGALSQALQRYRDTFTHATRIELRELFLFIDPRHIWVCNVGLCAVSVIAAFLLTRNTLAAIVVGIVTATVPRKTLAHLKLRRQHAFDHQLPDALLALGSALRAGTGMASALRYVADESEPPLAQELALLLREVRLGIPLDHALRNLAARIPTEATALTTSAMRLAASTGGGLAETLERIATTVRARLHMEARIRALTAQGRLQAWVLGALPVLMILALHQLEPEAMSLLWNSPIGWATLITIAILEGLGLWLIRRIVRIDV